MLTKEKKLRFWCQKVLPLVYDDSLSYYELLNKVVYFLNKHTEDINELIDLYSNFKDDVAEIIEEMLQSGEFDEAIEKAIKEINDQEISRYSGKKFSFLGDSITTFDEEGYKYENYNMYYPRGDIQDVNDTWFKKVLDNSGADLESNLSFSGSRVTNTHPYGYPDFYSRVSLLGNPDTIFVELGTNDYLNNIALGNYDFTTEYTELAESQFRPAYIKGMKALQALYPTAEIIAIITYMSEDYKNSIVHICDTLGIKYVDVSPYASSDANHVHPNLKGMRDIASNTLYEKSSKNVFVCRGTLIQNVSTSGNIFNQTTPTDKRITPDTNVANIIFDRTNAISSPTITVVPNSGYVTVTGTTYPFSTTVNVVIELYND